MLSAEEGTQVVRLAREALSRAYGAGIGEGTSAEDAGPSPAPFLERRGVFVTLKQYPSGDLRGCIGLPLPVLPLAEAVREAAVAAAREDPRFPPVSRGELDRLVVEVSVLTPPEPIPAGRPQETADQVVVGRDGLIVDGYGASGLLLPQVAPEQGWDAERFLAGTCEKAGLPSNCWKDPRVRLRRFQAEVFAETEPNGRVVREELTPRSRDGRRSR